MLRIEIDRSAQGMEQLRSAWDRLYHAGQYSLFQQFEWNLLAARMFVDEVPIVVHAESDSGAAIIPACVSDGRISLLGEALFDYRNVLAAGDEEVLRQAWGHVAVSQRPLAITAVRGEAIRQQWEELGFRTAPFCRAAGVRRAELSADDFAARHPKAERALRRLLKMGCTLSQHSGAETALVRQIYKAKSRQPMAGNLFAEDPARGEFMIAAAAMERGCEIFTVETAGTLVAALLTFRDGQVRRLYTTSFEPAWAHYSPGTVLLYEVARRTLEQDLDCDYMTGEQPHKARFASHGEPLYRVFAEAEELAHITGARAVSEGALLPRAA